MDTNVLVISFPIVEVVPVCLSCLRGISRLRYAFDKVDFSSLEILITEEAHSCLFSQSGWTDQGAMVCNELVI